MMAAFGYGFDSLNFGGGGGASLPWDFTSNNDGNNNDAGYGGGINDAGSLAGWADLFSGIGSTVANVWQSINGAPVQTVHPSPGSILIGPNGQPINTFGATGGSNVLLIAALAIGAILIIKK